MLGPGNRSGQPATKEAQPIATLVGGAFRVGAQIPLLLVSVLVAVTAPILTLQVQTTNSLNSAAVIEATLSSEVTHFFEQAERMAALQGALDFDSEVSGSRARELLLAESYAESVLVADIEGNVVAFASRSSDIVATPVNREALDWVASTSEVFVGVPQFDPIINRQAIVLAVPIISPRDEHQGMLQMIVGIEWMSDVISRTSQNLATNTYVIKETGELVFHADEWRVLNAQQLKNPGNGLREGLDGRLCIMGVVQTAPWGDAIRVVGAAPLSVLFPGAALGLVPLVLVMTSFGVSKLVKRRLVGSIVAPIHDLEKAVSSYGPEKASVRAGASSVTELDRVATSFNQTADTIDELVESFKRSNEQLEEFASVAAHDLQEPMRKVRAFGDLLATAPNVELTDEARGYIDRMQNAAARMQQLIDDLLAYSRVSNPTSPFQRVDLNEIVAEVLIDLEYVIGEAAAEVAVDDLPLVEAGATQIRQLMHNLLSNSVKFGRSGTPPRIRIAGRSGPNGQTTISVVDNGIGFDPKYDERVFGIFERLHGRGEYPGTGIGLALCRKIVERHGGTITAEGTEGEGATFTFTLPTYTP